MNEFIKEFCKECKKNREYLGYSLSDICACLIDVSEKDYQEFEQGKKVLSKENLIKISRILCVNKPNNIELDKYIDLSFMSEEDIEDVREVVELIVGDNDD